MLLEYFTKGTEGTVTGATIGMEIETDFRYQIPGVADTIPMGPHSTREILRMAQENSPEYCRVQLELGSQKLELSVAPQESFKRLYDVAMQGMGWLYRAAATCGAVPMHRPVMFDYHDPYRPLLYVQEERDTIWEQLDGRLALEHLCRCSSVQFTISVHPNDAIPMINALLRAPMSYWNYDGNDAQWRRYIADSRASYRYDRYGGPNYFENIEEYVGQLEKHDVVMHQGQIVRQKVANTPDLDVDLFLRSVWWHFRLRRYGDILALEMRPFGRWDDTAIKHLWYNKVYPVIKKFLRDGLVL
jgi:hypothetical protein